MVREYRQTYTVRMPTYTTTTRTVHVTRSSNRMGEISLNTRYLSTNRGIIKILQIVAGFIICSLLCSQWYGGRSCFGEGRLGFCSGLNFVCVIINIVLFVLNFLNIGAWGLERIYSVVSTVLFLIASVLIIWFIIEVNSSRGWLIASAVGIMKKLSSKDTHLLSSKALIRTICLEQSIMSYLQALIVCEFLLFLWDVKILQGEAPN
uniref:MARVEL domain-containing protein n=1 Tax=Heterorhabditis bacteriophora TaxID=37862 RepID=A0A1I7X5R0_HETBA